MPTYSLSACLFVYDKENKPTGDLEAAVARVAAAGFAETEVTAEGDSWPPVAGGEVAELKSALERSGLFPHTLHAPLMGINLASEIEAIRRDGIKQMAAALRVQGALGGRAVIVHPTGRPGADEEDYSWENIGAATERAHRSVCELVPVAAEAGVCIALENLPSTGLRCRPLVSMQELRAFIAAFPPEQVGLCLDTGHARISGLDPALQARIAGERLIALHLQDVDGEADCHWVPGDGVIDWAAMGQALADIGFDGAWTIEALCGKTDMSAVEVAAACTALQARWTSDGMS